MTNEFKKEAVLLALDKFEKVYIHCAPGKGLYVGKRGLVGNEKKGGIMLSFSAASCKSMKAETEGITAELRFAGVWENVFLPYPLIDAVIDDIQTPSFIFNFVVEKSFLDIHDDDIILDEIPANLTKDTHKTAQILKPDFTKKRK